MPLIDVNRDLKIEFFGISRAPWTSRSHVTRAWPSGFTCVWLDHALEVRADLPQGFLHSKTSQFHVREEMLLFGILLLNNYWILFHRNVTLKIIHHLKYKWVEWMNENKQGSCEVPPANTIVWIRRTKMKFFSKNQSYINRNYNVWLCLLVVRS